MTFRGKWEKKPCRTEIDRFPNKLLASEFFSQGRCLRHKRLGLTQGPVRKTSLVPSSSKKRNYMGTSFKGAGTAKRQAWKEARD